MPLVSIASDSTPSPAKTHGENGESYQKQNIVKHSKASNTQDMCTHTGTSV